ncbi:MAG: GNAT family N-acetyltransferase [Oscillospiraceae bacterium]|nr:GNAT family N-acetyltransferase [Oscillospiraceae bacterium]
MTKLRTPANPIHWLRIWKLYLRAFPPAERKPFGVIVKMHRSGKTDVWCVERDGRFAGFATTVNGEELILLDYLAIEKRSRGQGIGSAAMAAMHRIYADKGFFVEIESTGEDAANREAREKRKRFYEAAGMKALGVEADVFGVRMELLGSRCALDFEGYRAFYRDHYSPWAAQHLTQPGVM